jgi:hypothetical protein
MARNRQSTKPGPDRRRVTVAEAAEILGITAEAVRTRIKRGKLDSVKEPPGPAGTVYVLLQTDQTEPNLDATPKGQDRTSDQTPLVETLREQVAYLQGVIATRDRELEKRAEEIRRRDTTLEREQQLAAMFADRLQALEAPAGSSAARESPEGSGATAGEGEIWEELDTERARREMAETTLHEGIAEERWRREAAERERDELRRQLYGIREERESARKADEQQGRGRPHPDAPGAHGPIRRPWWRRMIGR